MAVTEGSVEADVEVDLGILVCFGGRSVGGDRCL